MKRLRIKDVIDLDAIIISESPNPPFFGSGLLDSLFDTLETYGVSEETWENSGLYGLLNNDIDLDLTYFVEHSEEKYLSNYFMRLYNAFDVSENPSEIQQVFNQLYRVISTKFAFKWWKIYLAITTNYKPLENYDMQEIRTPNLREELTRKQATDTNVHQESESGIYGFNSSTPQPTAMGEGDTHSTGLKANNEIEDVKSNTGTESLSRHGNIGVTTSQQMLESELKLRQYNFIEEVFHDIDSILCLKIY